jgi:hypothetical protein
MKKLFVNFYEFLVSWGEAIHKYRKDYASKYYY